MAASSGLATSFALKSRVHGVGTAFSSASLVRLHGGAMTRICRQRRGGVSLVSPRCEASGFDNDSLIKSIWPSATSADSLKYSRERCSIVAIVLCGPSTPVETREKLAVVESEWPRAIEELCKLEDIEEASVLSTCSRVEIYVLALCQDHGVSQVTDWISKSSGVPVSELCKHRVVLCNKDAVEHLFEVSSGLDSLVLGESQILASLEQVWSVGIGVKGFGRVVNELFWFAVGVGKRVRSETSIGAGAVCVSSAAVELALMKLSSSSLAMARMLVVGAGEMGKRVIQHLVARGCKKVVVVTRNESSVKEEMKGGVEIIYKPVSEMYDCAAAADVVFTTTTSRKPIFLRQHVEKLPPAQQLVVGAGGSRLFIDISVPRNVGSCVANLETARVYNVDDLKQFVLEANKDDRLIPEAMMKARPIIDEETNNFELLWNSWSFFTLENLRSMVEEMRIEWLEERLAEFGDDITETQRKAIEGDSRAWSHNRLKKVRAFFSRIELQLGSPEVPFRLDFDSIITLLDR